MKKEIKTNDIARMTADQLGKYEIQVVIDCIINHIKTPPPTANAIVARSRALSTHERKRLAEYLALRDWTVINYNVVQGKQLEVITQIQRLQSKLSDNLIIADCNKIKAFFMGLPKTHMAKASKIMGQCHGILDILSAPPPIPCTEYDIISDANRFIAAYDYIVNRLQIVLAMDLSSIQPPKDDYNYHIKTYNGYLKEANEADYKFINFKPIEPPPPLADDDKDTFNSEIDTLEAFADSRLILDDIVDTLRGYEL